MTISNFPNGFVNGANIRGVNIPQSHPGKVFWVNNSTVLADKGVGGSNGNPGTYTKPFSTIDYAIGRCKASRGDIIYVMPGHAETITGTDITLDVADVSVVGLGKGASMVAITHGHADAEVSVTAANVTWQNIRHTAAITLVKVAIEIEDGVDNVHVNGCKFDVTVTGTDEFLVSVRTNDASNFAVIEGCDIDMGLGGAVSAISFTADTDGTKVLNNRIEGDFSTACINGITTLSTKLVIDNNLLINGNSGAIGTEPGIELVTGSTGTISNNNIVCNLATKAASVVADTCMLFENYYNEDISGAATGGIIGTPSADG